LQGWENENSKYSSLIACIRILRGVVFPISSKRCVGPCHAWICGYKLFIDTWYSLYSDRKIDSENFICDKTRTKQMCSSDFCNSATITVLRYFSAVWRHIHSTKSCIRTKQLTKMFPFLGLQNERTSISSISSMYLKHFTLLSTTYSK
jgi:hypothetical protein